MSYSELGPGISRYPSCNAFKQEPHFPTPPASPPYPHGEHFRKIKMSGRPYPWSNCSGLKGEVKNDYFLTSRSLTIHPMARMLGFRTAPNPLPPHMPAALGLQVAVQGGFPSQTLPYGSGGLPSPLQAIPPPPPFKPPSPPSAIMGLINCSSSTAGVQCHVGGDQF